jgi:NADPH-dependent 2,4-dienoyl-CoA reductase/sulfur reductase-like enzyme/nitrite reductase/ring-hydroxylating ferredoxin subunit
MAAPNEALPDFGQGVSVANMRDGDRLLGRLGDEEVILVRSGDEIFAVGPYCTHYHGALADGLVVGDSVRCPLHHACFSLRTGEALRAPALDPIARWRVERRGDTVLVREKLAATPAVHTPRPAPASVVIVGGGGAGLAAADMLRREGYEGPITLISADDAPPCDRPNLSKDYLSGEAPEEWIPLRSPEYFTDNRIELLLRTRVVSVDVPGRRVLLDSGRHREFGALLIATGADPVRLPIPITGGAKVHYLRSLSDSRGIIADATGAKRAVVVGASFIGLEVAASLRARDVAVDVVAPGRLPLEPVMGAEVGAYIRQLHEAHGVVFHLGQTVARIDGRRATLSGGDVLDADVVVVGAGVRPAVVLAEAAGLALDRGIAVDEYLETSAPGVFAAGDVARWKDSRSGERRHVEHWVVAERQGQIAAKNILGAREPFDAVPFFWSQHYDVTIRYVGYAPAWDAVEVRGRLADRDATVIFTRGGQTVAVATLSRDRENLEAELAFERGMPL